MARFGSVHRMTDFVGRTIPKRGSGEYRIVSSVACDLGAVRRFFLMVSLNPARARRRRNQFTGLILTLAGELDTVSSVDDGSIAIHEYSGIATSSPLNATSTKTGTSNAPTTGIATSTVGNDLFFAVAWSQSSGDTWTGGNGYTLRQQEADNVTDGRMATEDQILSSASTSAAWYKTTTSDLWAGSLAAFKPQVTTTGGGAATSPDATSSQTTLWKDSATATFGGASYTIATTSGAITDTWTTAASQDWVMAAIALRPATSTSGGGGASAMTTRYFLPDHLNSTNVVTDASGTPLLVDDYYPYGSTRVT
jgi:hypothetical protein